MNTLKELQGIAEAAHRARYAISIAKDDMRREKESAFRVILNAELEEKFGADLKAAMTAEREAEEAVARERERIALAGEGVPFQIGTRLIHWGTKSRWTSDPTLIPTGKVGIAEVITDKSLHAANVRSYSRAQRGSMVIRLLKKDGTPSARYVHDGWEFKHRWIPEGINPNVKTEEATA